MISKNDIRREYLDKLSNFSVIDRRSDELILSQKLFNCDEWKQAKTVGITLSSDVEMDTLPIIMQAKDNGKKVVIPRTLKNRQMEFVEYSAQTKFITKFNIKEPVNGDAILKNQINLMIVPGVVFANNGYRIGFGGGYYDRYLSDFEGDTISLATRMQIIKNEDILPVIDSFDIKVKRILTTKVDVND